MDMSQIDENHGEADSTDSELVNEKPDCSRSYTNEDSLFLVNNEELAVNEIQVDDQNIEYLIVGCDMTTGDDITTLHKTVEEIQNDVDVLSTTSAPLEEVEMTPIESSSDDVPPSYLENVSSPININGPLTKQKVNVNVVPQNSSNSKKWDAKLTRSLIEIRKEMAFLFKFNKDKNQNTVLWNIVLEKLMQRNPDNPNCPVNLYECADKWRSLLMTYKINLAKYKKYGSSVVIWEYFNDIHEWMTNDKSFEFRVMKSSPNILKDLCPKKKLRIEKTLEKVPPTMLEKRIVVTKTSEVQGSGEAVNRPSHNTYIQPLQESSADYHFAMLILRELESLPPSLKDKKKQKMLLALYD